MNIGKAINKMPLKIWWKSFIFILNYYCSIIPKPNIYFLCVLRLIVFPLSLQIEKLSSKKMTFARLTYSKETPKFASQCEIETEGSNSTIFLEMGFKVIMRNCNHYPKTTTIYYF